MCGIVGFSGDFSLKTLSEMSAALSHRGPDGSGDFISEEFRVGLAHRRLAIIDLSTAAHQPMIDDTGQIVIVFNGEIYNFLELRNKLEVSGYNFDSHSDTEVLLNLYLKYGENMLSHLNGVFAFAIWDRRISSLFIARDPLGVKPLYYSETAKGVVFASELKSLLVNPEVTREIDSYAVMMYMAYLWCPSPHTILSSVKKLPPGCAMILKDGVIERSWQYYEIPYDQPISKISPADAIESVIKGVQDAVKRQMVSDVPVGAFLSGGLDSSAVVAFAQQTNPPKKLQCFTMDVDKAGKDGFVDDLPYARRVAEFLGVDLHVVQVNSNMIQDLEKLIYCLDEPLADPAALHTFFISQLAGECGIKVLLSGAGGDDIFGGYRRHYALQQEKFWAWMPKTARRFLASSSARLSVKNSSLRRIRKAFQYADADGDERLTSYFYWCHPDLILKLLSPSCRKNINGRNPSEPFLKALKNIPADTADLNRMLFLESKFFLADHNLNYTDKMSMANGVEVRVPLLDLDLVALTSRLPVEYKQRGSEGKWIFKKAMEKYLPHDVIYRPKTGFGAPLRSWLHSKSCLEPLLRDLLSETSINRRDIFDSSEVDRLIELDRQGIIDASYTLFSMMCIELWCRTFIDKDFVK